MRLKLYLHNVDVLSFGTEDIGGKISQSLLADLAFIGLRAAIGSIFIANGLTKFGPGFAGFISTRMGLPPEFAVVLGLAETVGGALLIFGIFSRIGASWLSIIMLGAIILVRGAASLTGDNGAALDVLMLGALLVIIVAGPGRISVGYVLARLPRFLH